MKIILLENVRKIGSIGDVIDVKRGFARNYLISKKKALLSIDPNSLDTLLHPTLDENSKIEGIAKGLPASPGAASG